MGREVGTRLAAEQTTIAQPVIKSGIGLHTGERCAVSLLPAEPDAGVVFVSGGVEIPGKAEFVVDTRRGTTLGRRSLPGGAGETPALPGRPTQVGCVEHLMAALYGLGVENVRVEVEGAELPALDGCAGEWVKALRRAGLRRLGVARKRRRLDRAVWASDGAAWAVAAPARGGLTLAVGVEFENTAAGRQTLWMRVSPGRFARELAPARTFAMAEELEALRADGLSKGGSLENAFVVGREGYVGELRFEDEVVRHKALDLLGDIALCGGRFEGQVVAVRPSHRVNVELAGKLQAVLGGTGSEGEGVARRERR